MLKWAKRALIGLLTIIGSWALISSVGLYGLLNQPKGATSILDKDDYQPLLDSCRLVMASWSNKVGFTHEASEYGLLPEAISVLQPNYVHILKGQRVSLIWYSGVWSHGVQAYSDNDGNGKQELCPGLWYFCEKSKR
jgi:hypothetical protein